MREKDTYLLWMDLETTGIEPEDGLILEAAYCLTGLNLEPMSEAMDNKPIRQKRERVLSRVDDYVLKMHTDSGLLYEVWDEKKSVPLGEFATRLKNNLRRHMKPGDRVHLAGSSIHSR